MALPGVAITSIKAMPPVRAMIMDASSGLIPGISVDMASPMGSNMATAPMFDIIFVNNIVKTIMMRIAR